MMVRMQAGLLPGGRLHLNDGPIDLIVSADGGPVEVACAFTAARERFASILNELCTELKLLREAVRQRPQGVVAQRMWAAVLPLASGGFITPMAAVAGAVAEEVLAAMTGAALLERAAVNNGGDIALHLASGASYRIGLIDRPDRPSLLGSAVIASTSAVRGVATSGWRGRSFSLGIADAVTVLARTASGADAAATVIANAVDLPGHPAILRERADRLQPDNDLRHRLVTRAVGPLTPREIATALAAGIAVAQDLRRAGLIIDCALHLAGQTRALAQTELLEAVA
jgi:uncharacterized protein